MARRGASTAGAAAGGGPDGAGTEQVDQQITATLRAIDGDFVKAADLAASMLGDVRTFTANMKATHAGLQVGGAVAPVGSVCRPRPTLAVRACCTDTAVRRSHQLTGARTRAFPAVATRSR